MTTKILTGTLLYERVHLSLTEISEACATPASGLLNSWKKGFWSRPAKNETTGNFPATVFHGRYVPGAFNMTWN